MSAADRRPLDRDDAEVLDGYSAAVSGVAERVLPSVASIQVTAGDRRQAGFGSAVVVEAGGVMVTSAHVVGGGREGWAATLDSGQIRFEVAGADPLSDLAVLRCEPGLPPLVLGDAERLRVGQLVIAVGSPLGYRGTVTAGVVSGLRRWLPVFASERGRRPPPILENLIQTDAALNPGNSGGALADSRGRLVGVNTAVAGVGVGLAVPINAVTRRILGALLDHGRVRRGYLGIAGGTRSLPPDLAERLGRRTAVAVLEVMAGSPAARAGIHPEDLLTDAGAVHLERTADLQALLVEATPGTRVEFTLIRRGRRRWLSVSLGEGG